MNMGHMGFRFLRAHIPTYRRGASLVAGAGSEDEYVPNALWPASPGVSFHSADNSAVTSHDEGSVDFAIV